MACHIIGWKAMDNIIPEIAEKLEAVAERYRAELGEALTCCEGTGRRKPGYR